MTSFTTVILAAGLMFFSGSAASADDVVFRHSHSTFIEERLSAEESHTWHVELQSYGILTMGNAFPDPHVSWSLWAVDSAVSRIGHRGSQTAPVKDSFHLAPGNYEIRAQAAEPALLQLSLQFQNPPLPAVDKPAFRRNEGGQLSKGRLLAGYFGYRHTAAPVLPGEHYRTLTMSSGHDLAVTVYAPDSPVPIRAALWKEHSRLDYVSAEDTATLHIHLDSGSYSVGVQTQWNQEPAAYVLFVIEPGRSDELQLLDSMPDDEAQTYNRENPILLGFNRLICPGSVDDAIRLLDHQSRSIPVEIESSGGLVIVTPQLNMPAGSTFRLRINPSLRSRDGTTLPESLELVFRTAIQP